MISSLDLCKVFSLYTLCDVAITDVKPYVQDYVEGVDFVQEVIICERTNYSPSLIKLLLKDIDDISDEDATELSKICCNSSSRYLISSFTGKKIAQTIKDSKCYLPSLSHLNFSFAKEFLIKKKYAVPIFFGVDHPANNISLFDLGVAIRLTVD